MSTAALFNHQNTTILILQHTTSDCMRNLKYYWWEAGLSKFVPVPSLAAEVSIIHASYSTPFTVVEPTDSRPGSVWLVVPDFYVPSALFRLALPMDEEDG
eukprot:m.412111 g.412111  ORF g.412111 m.412111 type:complete len:100 (+) comp56563_c0_seq7:1073-1372(+)